MLSSSLKYIFFSLITPIEKAFSNYRAIKNVFNFQFSLLNCKIQLNWTIYAKFLVPFASKKWKKKNVFIDLMTSIQTIITFSNATMIWWSFSAIIIGVGLYCMYTICVYTPHPCKLIIPDTIAYIKHQNIRLMPIKKDYINYLICEASSGANLRNKKIENNYCKNCGASCGIFSGLVGRNKK